MYSCVAGGGLFEGAASAWGPSTWQKLLCWGRVGVGASEGMGATGSPYLGQGPPPQGSGADWEKKAPNQAPTRKNSRVGKALPYPPKQCFLPSCGMATFLPWNPLPLPVGVGENTSWCEGSAGAPDLGTLSSGPHVLFLLPVSSPSYVLLLPLSSSSW